MKYEDYKTKAENWDYYQELLKQNGFSGITDLLTKYKQLKQAQPSPAVAVPDFESWWTSQPSYRAEHKYPAKIAWEACCEIMRSTSTNNAVVAVPDGWEIKKSVGSLSLGNDFLVCGDGSAHLINEYKQPQFYRFLDAMLSTPTPPSAEPYPTTESYENELAEKFMAEQPDSADGNDVMYLMPTGEFFNGHATYTGHIQKPDNFVDESVANHKIYLERPSKPQHITEPELRAIGLSLFKYAKNENPWWVDNWIESEDGRTLLAKLNEYREPDYKAQRDELLNELVEIRTIFIMTDNNVDLVSFIAKLDKAIAKANASTEVKS